jgi:hypothetical protein
MVRRGRVIGSVAARRIDLPIFSLKSQFRVKQLPARDPVRPIIFVLVL